MFFPKWRKQKLAHLKGKVINNQRKTTMFLSPHQTYGHWCLLCLFIIKYEKHGNLNKFLRAKSRHLHV